MYSYIKTELDVCSGDKLVGQDIQNKVHGFMGLDIHNKIHGFIELDIQVIATSDKVYQLLAHGRWFSLGTPASSTTKTGCHEIAEILLKVALNTKNQSINHYKL